MKKLFAIAVLAVFFLQNSLITNASGSRTVSFSGYTWNVKNSYMGPGPNWWTDDANDVYVDSNGALHLSVINRNNIWYSSEVYLPSSLGYGTYTFTTNSNVDSFDPNLVLGLFMYQDDTHEIDIEYSRWGYANGTNLGYSVQPYYIKGNNYTLNLALDRNVPVVNEINWQPEKITFKISQNGATLNEWTYTGTNNFVPGSERLDINFWLMKGLAPINGQNAEVTINSFNFTPYTTPIIEPAITSTVQPVTTTTTPTTTVTSPTTTDTQKVYRKVIKQLIRKIHKTNYIKKGVRIR